MSSDSELMAKELEALRKENEMLKSALNLAAADAAAARSELVTKPYGNNDVPPSQSLPQPAVPAPTTTPSSTDATTAAMDNHLLIRPDGSIGIASGSSKKTLQFAGGGGQGQDGGGPLTLGAPPCGRFFGVGHLHRDEVERYSRQALLPHFGSQGCRDLIDSHVLVVGAGGLGSTIIPYLAAAGVGKIRIVDFDDVERSNLHRQIIHTDDRCGIPKAVSAEIAATALNPAVQIDTIIERFDVTNAQRLLEGVDVVLDATDNVASRYLVNDACVYANKPLVSGGATRWEGQLTVYNFTDFSSSQTANTEATQTTSSGGPCYRCLFPEPTPPSMVGNCNDVGVVGPVPGMIGCLQALEAIKVLLLLGEHHKLNSQTASPSPASPSGRPRGIEVMAGKMLMFDGLRGGYRTIKLRPKQPNCRVCNAESRKYTSVEEAFYSGEFPEYIPVSCNIAQPFDVAVLVPALSEMMRSSPFIKNIKNGDDDNEVVAMKVRKALMKRIKETCVLDMSLALPSVGEMADMAEEEEKNTEEGNSDKKLLNTLPLLILDVRAPEQFNLCGIPGTLPISLSEIESNPSSALAKINAAAERRMASRGTGENVEDVYVLCRRGINSMKAVKILGSLLAESDLDNKEKEEGGATTTATPVAPSVGAIVNIAGGLGQWHAEVDSNFPLY